MLARICAESLCPGCTRAHGQSQNAAVGDGTAWSKAPLDMGAKQVLSVLNSQATKAVRVRRKSQEGNSGQRPRVRDSLALVELQVTAHGAAWRAGWGSGGLGEDQVGS